MDKFLVNNLLSDSWNYPSLIQPVQLPEITAAGIHADVLRLDTIHPVVSGNKWFKLKGHLQTARLRSASSILTFGGAWSNHIVAAAYAAQQAGLPSIGIIRGERPPVLSATLETALACGMQLEFISRKQYASLTAAPGHGTDPGVYIIPEGGAGPDGIRASEHILREAPTTRYTHILCAIGTGTMFLGLAAAATPEQEVIGISVLKGMEDAPGQPYRHRIIPHYHFGGYARHPPELLDFMNRFYRDTGIPSDLVYTGKLFYAALDMVRQNLFPAHSRLLIVHSGGLQGNRSLPPGRLNF
ncbi:MAG TPA: pyridoxal-phosphate dependent enzyme [Puia sp.]|jgi:1-aminocyclopropane-1-carboxylate deaminase